MGNSDLYNKEEAKEKNITEIGGALNTTNIKKYQLLTTNKFESSISCSLYN